MLIVEPYVSSVDVFVAQLTAKYPAAHVYAVGPPDARTFLLMQENRCHVVFVGEATPYQVQEALQLAKADGMSSVGTGLLLDFSRYTGSLDWDYVKRDHSMIPGMKPQPSKAAYLWSDMQGELLTKSMAIFFAPIECRAFVDYHEAIAWLGWE